MKLRAPASRMTETEIVAEIHDLHRSMDDSARRIAELSHVMHRLARRNDDQHLTSAYLAYAQAWNRFASMVGYGLRRTATTERVLTAAIQAQERAVETEPKPEPKPTPETQPSGETDADLEAVYGEVLNAQ